MAASKMSFSWAGGIAELGKTLTITITRDNQAYRHYLAITFNGRVASDLYGIASMTTYTPSYDLATYLSNGATSGTLKIVCYTYNGSAQPGNMGAFVGSTELSATVNVPSDINPTLTDFTLSDPNGYLTTYGAYVATKSDLQAVVNASGTHGATITQYKLSIGSSWTTSDVSTLTIVARNINITGTINVTATVTDSRGYYTQKTKQITVASYSPPSLADSNVKRWNTSTNQEDDESNVVRINVAGSICNVNNKSFNTGTAKIETSPYDSESWTTRDTRSVGTSSFNYNYDVSGMDENQRYRVRITVTDSFGIETSSILVVDTAIPVVDFKSNGKGIAFFGVSSKDGFEVNSNAEFNGTSTFDGVIQLNNYTTGIWRQELGGSSSTWHEIARSSISTTDLDGSGQIRIYGTIGGFGATSRGYFDIVIIPRDFVNDRNVIVLQKTPFNSHLCNLQIYKDSSNVLHVYIVRYPNQYYTYNIYVEGFQCLCPNTITSTSPTYSNMDLCGDLTTYSHSIFPVGTVLIRYDHISPASLYGGAWTRISGAFLYATGSTGTIGATGGSGTHTLTVSQMPSHAHNIYWKPSSDEASGYGLVYNGNGFNNRAAVTGWRNGVCQYVGGGQAHNNNPYHVNVSAWRRTA